MKPTRLIPLFAFAALFVSPAFATEDANHPCKKIAEACKSAGYLLGQHKNGKGLHMDCMKKLMAGEKVEGVTVSPDDVAACKAKKEKRKEEAGKAPAAH